MKERQCLGNEWRRQKGFLSLIEERTQVTKMHTTSKIIVGIALGAMLALHFIWPRILFKAEEIAFCRRFVLDNSAVRDYLGAIKSIKLVNNKGTRGVIWSTEEGKVTDGIYRFLVNGESRKGRVRAHWQKKHDVMEVTKLSMRKGFAGTMILWPESQATVRFADYILPSHVWDGIISLGIAGLCLLFHAGFKRRAKWATLFFFFVARSERMRAFMKLVCIFAGLTSLIESALCFLNVTTLF